VHYWPMDSNSRLIAIVCGLCGPVGAVVAALALSKAADLNNGGMAGLAGLVSGLMVGGPLLAFLAFCLLMALPPGRSVHKKWLAIVVMLAAALIDLAVAVIGIVLMARSGGSPLALVLVAVVSIAALAYGAILAVRAGGVRPPDASAAH
jgi:hypothetical protein